MSRPVIEVKDLTKDYGEGRGVFDINLDIYEGETVGFVGTNGSGKTTTIRNIMGFLKPTSGHAYVNGLEANKHAAEIAKDIGYVPGEIAFPDLPTGVDFLKSRAEFLGVKDGTKTNFLIEKLQLDPRASLKRMSKGMKQKTAVVAALMSDPSIIILDEPTTGLDPLMREAFLEIIADEHSRGKTIFMSSHMFEETEKICSRTALIMNGHIVDIADMKTITERPVKDFKIEFLDREDYERFKKLPYNIVRDQSVYNQVTVCIPRTDISALMHTLADGYKVKFISERKYDMQRYFREVLQSEKERVRNVQ